MTPSRTWTARQTRRRLRRRHAVLRWTVAGSLVGGGGAAVLAVALPVQDPPVTAPTVPAAPDTPEPAAAQPSPPSATTEPAPSPPSTVTTPARIPTAGDPLRVWIAGDSMWELAGPALADLVEATGVATVEVDVHYSTGLTRPDFFDWSAEVDEVLRRDDPEVVVFLVGANDSQPLVEDAAVHDPGTPGFDAAYGARVEALMGRLADGGRQVLWVGLPVMRARPGTTCGSLI